MSFSVDRGLLLSSFFSLSFFFFLLSVCIDFNLPLLQRWRLPKTWKSMTLNRFRSLMRSCRSSVRLCSTQACPCHNVTDLSSHCATLGAAKPLTFWLKVQFKCPLLAHMLVHQVPSPKKNQTNIAFQDDSALLRHEVAYCLGQMQDPYAIPSLELLLKDTTENSMVRHEVCTIHHHIMSWAKIWRSPNFVVAGRRGTWSHWNSRFIAFVGTVRPGFGTWSGRDMPFGYRYHQIQTQEQKVRKNFRRFSSILLLISCSLSFVRWNRIEKDPVYLSIDPAPPSSKRSPEELKKRLMDASLPMFKRYRAMFALRDQGTQAAVEVIASFLCFIMLCLLTCADDLSHGRHWQKHLSIAVHCCAMK